MRKQTEVIRVNGRATVVRLTNHPANHQMMTEDKVVLALSVIATYGMAGVIYTLCRYGVI